MKIVRHFTAITHVVYGNRALLMFHKKYQMWLPVGGHVEENELPQEAAIREVKEESGLDVELYQHDADLVINADNAKVIIPPIHVVLVDMEVNHQHMDLIFYATAKSADFIPSQDEAKEMRWLSAEEIKSMNDMPDNVKVLALEAIDILGNKTQVTK